MGTDLLDRVAMPDNETAMRWVVVHAYGLDHLDRTTRAHARLSQSPLIAPLDLYRTKVRIMQDYAAVLGNSRWASDWLAWANIHLDTIIQVRLRALPGAVETYARAVTEALESVSKTDFNP